jgi:hypothetical protein
MTDHAERKPTCFRGRLERLLPPLPKVLHPINSSISITRVAEAITEHYESLKPAKYEDASGV